MAALSPFGPRCLGEPGSRPFDRLRSPSDPSARPAAHANPSRPRLGRNAASPLARGPGRLGGVSASSGEGGY